MKGIYTKFTNQTLAAAIVSTQVMKLIATKNGFYEFYVDVMLCSGDSKKAFDTTNEIYKKFFNGFKYENYADFYKEHAAVEDKESALFIQRNFLMQFFKEKGFTTWESFSPLVLNFYPQIGAAQLRAFYNGSALDKEVINYVDFVRQIIS